MTGGCRSTHAGLGTGQLVSLAPCMISCMMIVQEIMHVRGLVSRCSAIVDEASWRWTFGCSAEITNGRSLLGLPLPRIAASQHSAGDELGEVEDHEG
ncbi:hypothetical protein Asn12ST33_00690 [Cutibacterium acnes]|nr:hypothetical protein Asn12ST33_00690 [Cutibacterium acnes]